MLAHVDADSFFVATLVRKDPRLRGKEILAMGMGGTCVIAASYEAKAKGVKTGMHIKDAVKLTPHALQLRSDFAETALASEQIELILKDECLLLEQFSVDEWFLDLTSIIGGVPEDLLAWARMVQRRILRETALSVSVGVGPSKLLAKMAGEYRKPAGVMVVRERPEMKGELSIEAMLRDRPAAAIPGIGPRRNTHAESLGWQTAWDIATAPTETLIELFGRPGAELQQELRGVCLSPVTVESDPPKSISRCRSFLRTADRKFVWAHVLRHLEYTVLKMRRQALACCGVSVWLRHVDYQHESETVRLPQPMNTEERIRPYVERCFRSQYQENVLYSQAGLCLWDLRPSGSPQYSLFESPSQFERTENVQAALDELHEQYGRDAVTRGAALGVGSGSKKKIDMPMY